MIPQLRRYLLDNWSQLPESGPKPRNLQFLVQATGISKLCCFVFVRDSAEPTWVAKMPRTPRDNDVLAHEYRITSHLIRTGDDYVRETVPVPVLTTMISGHLVGIERYIPGRPMDGLMGVAPTLQSPAIVENLRAAVCWLLKCQQATATEPTRLTKEQVQVHFLAPISQIKATCRLDSLELAYLDRLGSEIGALAAKPLPLVFKHGDFQPGNLLVDEQKLQVIDWEFGEVAAPPLLDLFGFLMRTFARYKGLEEMDGYLEDYLSDFGQVFFSENEFSTLCLEHVENACETLHIDPEWIRALFGLFLVTEANKYYTLLSRRADRGYLYLLKSHGGQTGGSFSYQLARQKQVWLLGYLAQHNEQLIFGGRNWSRSRGNLRMVV